MNVSNEPKKRERRATAVIAVHGVGDQKPFETARAIGDMLQELGVEGRDASKKPPECANPGPEMPRYYPFREQGLRINVNPVVMQDGKVAPFDDVALTAGLKPKRESLKGGTHGPFNEWVDQRIRERQETKKTEEDAKRRQPADFGAASRPILEHDIHTEFMKGQLLCYGGDNPEDTYETIRLEGERAPEKSGETQDDVHIYELYWADLSRLKAGIFSIFTELYQLLFHLSSLGSHTVNAAMIQPENLDSKRWRWFRNLQNWSSMTLAVPIPVLNILMLGITLVVAGLGVLQKAEEKYPTFGVALIAVIGGVVVALVLGYRLWVSMCPESKPTKHGTWFIPLLLAVLTSGWILKRDPIFGTQSVSSWVQEHLLSIESVILSVLAVLVCVSVIKQYNKRRPGLWPWVIGLTIAVVAVTAISWLYRCPYRNYLSRPTYMVLLRAVESGYAVLSVAWLTLYLLVFFTWVAGHFAPGVRFLDDQPATRSRWTGCLLLSLPTLIFSAVTILGWVVIVKSIDGLLPVDGYTPFLPRLEATCAFELAQAFLNGPGYGLLIVLFGMGVAALPAIWGMAPIVWPEVFPPPSYKALNAKMSEPLGRWLSLAYRWGLLLSGGLLFIASTFVLPAVTIAAAVKPTLFTKHPGIESLGVLSGALFTWVFLARGQLKKLALGFRPVLDIMLDVDNWLREHPLDKNPRARICGRYISLLRYICQWKNDDHCEGYDQIVIVAHSQGTVITADLLRFLNQPSDTPEKKYIQLDMQLIRLSEKKLPLKFFSMGCPLRQLYGRRFPYLYGWAVHRFDHPMEKWDSNDLEYGGGSGTSLPGPNPIELGVASWINAFRSGDYVGRHLWRSDQCSYLWEPDKTGAGMNPWGKYVSADKTRLRKEFCIGAGAHTHYWDRTAPMIAVEIDRLIKV
jgi:hypothetical protein